MAMRIDISEVGPWWERYSVGARGCVYQDGEEYRAIVEVPCGCKDRRFTAEEIEDFARILLIQEFAAGHWYQVPAVNAYYQNGSWIGEPNYPIRVEA